MPGEVPVGSVPAPEAPAPQPVPPAIAAREAKAAKMVSLKAGLTKLMAEQGTTEAKPTETAAQAAPVVEAKAEAPVEKPAEKLSESKPEPKVETKTDDELDDKTKRGLAAIDKAAKKFRDEQAAAKAELEVQRAEVARLRAEASGKVTSKADLKKLRATELLQELDHLSEEDYEVLSRQAWARTKAGKADPKAQAAAEQTTHARAQASKIADLETRLEEALAKIAEVSGEFTKRDAAAETKAFVTKWQDEAVKAIPADKPTLIAKLHAKSPEKARAELLAIGQHLEKQNDNETPTHAEVIELYEKLRRAELEEQGVDVDALLAPSKSTPATKPVPKTLDLTSTTGTRPINDSPTRAEKLASVTAGLKTLGGS